VRGTLLDDAVVQAAFKEPVDAVVHLAAWAGVRPSIEQPALYHRENLEVTVKLMDAVRAEAGRGRAIPKFVFASSSSVYGGNTKVPFHEDDPVLEPISPYAATKRCCELLSWTYAHLYGLQVTGLRFFTVYGPRQRPEMAIHKFAQLLSEGRAVPRYGDGSTARDYTYIDDIVQGVVAAVDRCGQTAPWRLYNLGNNRTVTLSRLIELVASALDVTARIEALPDQPGDVPLTNADVSRAQAELGYNPAYPIERGLEHFARWFKDRQKRTS
jgi:UDP-glucuronate 4-epimerase